MTERRRCDQRSEPALERSYASEERRLETWTVARRFRHLEQQLSVDGASPSFATTRLSQSISIARPKRRSCHQSARFHGVSSSVSDATNRRRASCARSMLFLVPDDILALHSGQGEHPSRDQHARSPEPDRGRPDQPR